MRPFVLLLASILAVPLFAANPPTTSNDDSCDIAVQPAATLLLPYFEVDFRSPQTTAVTTLFTVTNVSNQPQIAHVTLWTDWGYPALTFSIFLTGYDVQGINLYDVFARAILAPGRSGTPITTTVPANPTSGSQPASNTSNPHFLSNVTAVCTNLPGVFVPSLRADLQQIFTPGVPVDNSLGCPPAGGQGPVDRLGGVHSNAVG